MAQQRRNDRDRRREAAYERLGTRSPCCQHCGETDPAALTGQYPDITCYDCLARQQGRSPVENHHLPGKANSPVTGSMPGNGHRVLSDWQRDWPARTLRNPDQSPLLGIAATIRGLIDWFRLMIDRYLGWIPESLETLDEILRRLFGDQWWGHLGWSV